MHTLMAVLAWAIFGIIVGAIGRMLVPGRQTLGMGATMLLGIVGSLVGGFLSWLVAGGGPDQPYQPAGWIMSIVGAVLLVWIASATLRSRPVGH